MNSLKKIGFVICFLLINAYCFAQQMNTNEEDKTDFIRSNGKIYVVLAVCLTIVIGLFIYLINLDRKIKKLENDINNKGLK